MTKRFKLFLMNQIRHNNISYVNDHNVSMYLIPANEIMYNFLDPSYLEKIQDDIDMSAPGVFAISCECSTDYGWPMGIYRIGYNDTILETTTAPLFTKKIGKPASDFISLAYACSKKVIFQQQVAQQQNMLLNMLGGNQYTS